jgi:tripartite-type tricarboxylate transporter receptor subunit TctC
MTAMMVRCLVAVAFAWGPAASSAVAQDYPSRPVKILVGFGPGGLGDIVTRAVAQKLSVQMGQRARQAQDRAVRPNLSADIETFPSGAGLTGGEATWT